MKILIRATNWIGDAVLSLPAVRMVRERYPDAEICVLARPWVADLYLGEPSIDSIIPLAGGNGARDFSAKWQQARELRRERFDMAVLLPNSFESAALVYSAGIPRRVGYDRDGRGLLLTDSATPVRDGRHERYYYPEMLRRTGIIDSVPEIPEIRFAQTEAAQQRGRELLTRHSLGNTVIGVSPGAAFGGAKRWLPERFATAARTLAERLGGRVAVFGSGAEQEMCAQVAQSAGGINLAGRTSLREFIDITAACRFFLTNDSGAMHIAAALGTPSVTVFGPTDEIGTGPVSPTAHIVREPVECAPCKLRECPIDHRCMTGVSAGRVIDEGFRILATT